jgi:predicted dienelactone hydrolase
MPELLVRLDRGPGGKLTRRGFLGRAAKLAAAGAAAAMFTERFSPGRVRAEQDETTEAYGMSDGVLHDDGRNRDVPYRIYVPEPLTGVYPIIVMSHGVGGSREVMPYLGRYLAQNGYVALQLQHPGTDNSVWLDKTSLDDIYDALRQAMWDGKSAVLRFQDVPFAVGELARWNAEGPLAGHLDLDRIGMAGHSYGAVSTMVAAGQRMGPGGQWFFKEPRIKAGLVMSPSVPIQGGDLAELYRDIDIPLFHVTGTNDGNPIPGNRDFDPVLRTLPYETLTIAHQYLLVLAGAGHNAFSGLEYGPHAHGAEVETRYTRAVQEGAVLFFDAYVKGDMAAEAALRETFPSSLAPDDRFEWK